MLDGVLIYLSIGMALWLMSRKGYFDSSGTACNKIIATLAIIVFWPILWGLVLLLRAIMVREGHNE